MIDCGDNSCMFGRRGGMRTNGGCRCLGDRSKIELARELFCNDDPGVARAKFAELVRVYRVAVELVDGKTDVEELRRAFEDIR